MTLLGKNLIADDVRGNAAGEAPLLTEPAVLRLRAVHRAAAELRRGVPVLLTGPEPLVVLPAETAGASGLSEFSAMAAELPVLLLAPLRAAALLHKPGEHAPSPVAVKLSPRLLHHDVLRGLADPSAELLLPEPPEPAMAPVFGTAALSLTKLARLLPAALAASPRPGATEVAERLHILSVPAGDVLAYPAGMAAGLRQVAEAQVPLEGAEDARVVAFRGPDAGIEHLAILVGDPANAKEPLVRLHSECFTGDLLGSLRCDCGQQLRGAIRRMADEGAGVLLYLAQEGRGIGLVNKLRAYTLQDRGLDTVDANRALGWGADERNYLLAATMLAELGVSRIRLLTNNPDKLAALAACGVSIVARVAHAFAPNGVNNDYLATKAERFGHLLP